MGALRIGATSCAAFSADIAESLTRLFRRGNAQEIKNPMLSFSQCYQIVKQKFVLCKLIYIFVM
jgi:hypothetical protein